MKKLIVLFDDSKGLGGIKSRFGVFFADSEISVRIFYFGEAQQNLQAELDADPDGLGERVKLEEEPPQLDYLRRLAADLYITDGLEHKQCLEILAILEAAGIKEKAFLCTDSTTLPGEAAKLGYNVIREPDLGLLLSPFSTTQP